MYTCGNVCWLRGIVRQLQSEQSEKTSLLTSQLRVMLEVELPEIGVSAALLSHELEGLAI